MMDASVLLSNALVASSASNTGAFFSIARAIATRCFSPPESLRPRSPTCVSSPSGRMSTRGLRWQLSTTRRTSSVVALRSP
mmetsp:Transcript_8385/g.13606  ORF Transcript_8385/g.13606 Transcript_8385/m.13606 type:complete len:81 (+) Transcript_8385:1895-2137(+)